MKTTHQLSIILVFISTAIYAQRFDDVEIKTTKLSENTYILESAVGNIGISFGDGCVFVMDDQLIPLSEKVLASIKSLGNKPLGFS